MKHLSIKNAILLTFLFITFNKMVFLTFGLKVHNLRKTLFLILFDIPCFGLADRLRKCRETSEYNLKFQQILQSVLRGYP